MAQSFSARRSSKRKREPESEDQNQASKVPVVQDPNKDVQSNSTTRSRTMSSVASPTLPSSSEPCWDYDVFLSFRGETRKNFTDHLYSALDQVGIRTFRDDEELRRGEKISTELLNAIQRSRIFIVVFSKDYASSKWCLDELVEIVRLINAKDHTNLLPIFYHVDPSDIRKQTGTFAKSFAKHEKLFPAKRVQSWRAALTEAGNCAGWDLTNKYESNFIQEIVDEVWSKVKPARLDVAIHPVGIKSRVEEIKALLDLGKNNVCTVGFYGMGGIGKTTIAKAVYNNICHRFDESSFLLNIKDISKDSKGLVHLQEQLLFDILHKKDLNVNNVDKGISLIEKSFKGKKVLIVLDDVDHFKQLHSIVGNLKLFGPGSRLIATTRDKELLTQLGVDEKYEVRKLNHEESLELLSLHAFKMANPFEGYLELSNSAVKYTGGLPLALEVVGSSLLGKSVYQWKRKLEKLEKIPDREIQEKLKMSFDSLDDETREIFLDIACFFIGMDKKYTIKILYGCGFFPDVGINTLIQRSLVTIDLRNKLRMHDLIRDMGRELVREKSPRDLGKRSRLWFQSDVLDVLHKHKVFNKLKVLNLSNSKYLNKSPNFSQVPQLEILILKGCTSLAQVHESVGCLKMLVSLNLKNCTKLKDLPRSIFNLESLKSLDLSGCSALEKFSEQLGNMLDLTKLPPSSFGLLKNLKSVKLFGCSNLTELPNFLQAPHLKRLELEGCTWLRSMSP